MNREMKDVFIERAARVLCIKAIKSEGKTQNPDRVVFFNGDFQPLWKMYAPLSQEVLDATGVFDPVEVVEQ